jgi:hypothetical protein
MGADRQKEAKERGQNTRSDSPRSPPDPLRSLFPRSDIRIGEEENERWVGCRQMKLMISKTKPKEVVAET